MTLEHRANEQGHLYGAVSATDIAKSLQSQGYAVAADDIELPGKLDQINNYTVHMKFAEESGDRNQGLGRPRRRQQGRHRRRPQGHATRARAGEQFRAQGA